MEIRGLTFTQFGDKSETKSSCIWMFFPTVLLQVTFQSWLILDPGNITFNCTVFTQPTVAVAPQLLTNNGEIIRTNSGKCVKQYPLKKLLVVFYGALPRTLLRPSQGIGFYYTQVLSQHGCGRHTTAAWSCLNVVLCDTNNGVSSVLAVRSVAE